MRCIKARSSLAKTGAGSLCFECMAWALPLSMLVVDSLAVRIGLCNKPDTCPNGRRSCLPTESDYNTMSQTSDLQLAKLMLTWNLLMEREGKVRP